MTLPPLSSDACRQTWQQAYSSKACRQHALLGVACLGRTCAWAGRAHSIQQFIISSSSGVKVSVRAKGVSRDPACAGQAHFAVL